MNPINNTPMLGVHQYEATAKTRGGRMKLSPTHEDVAVCCPVTALKFFPYFVNGLWMKTADGNGLVAVNYAPNDLRTKINGVDVRIESETAYPFEDEVRMKIAPATPVAFGIRLRIPGWAGGMDAESPGAKIANDGDWLVLTKEWKAGDRIAVFFQPDVERRTMPNGEVYWRRGPLVYALPIAADIQQTKSYPVAGFGDYEYTPKAGAFWEYAAEEGSAPFRFAKTAAQGNPWIDPPVRLAGNLINRKTGQSEPVELQPMGAHILRRVAFPEVMGLRALESQSKTLKSEWNLARMATVKASSVSAGYTPQAIVDGKAQGYPENQAAEWASSRETTGAKVALAWERPVTIENVWLFDRPNPADHVQAAWINFSDGTGAMVGELPNDGTGPFKLDFPEKNIDWMEIIIIKTSPKTKNAGFSEIAVFQQIPGE